MQYLNRRCGFENVESREVRPDLLCQQLWPREHANARYKRQHQDFGLLVHIRPQWQCFHSHEHTKISKIKKIQRTEGKMV